MFEETIHPQFSDSDLFGHTNYLAAARWFERGRTPLYLEIDPEMNPAKMGMVIVKTEVLYFLEIFIDRPVIIKTFVSKIGIKSFTVEQEAWQNDHLCAKNTTVFCGFNSTTHSSAVLPDSTKDILKKHLPQV